MTRPTCSTCPYWCEDKSNVLNHKTKHGECRRYAPGFILYETAYAPANMSADFWCGEHPDFDAFIDSKRYPADPPLLIDYIGQANISEPPPWLR